MRPYQGLSQRRGDKLPLPVRPLNCEQRGLPTHPPGTQLQARTRRKLRPPPHPPPGHSKVSDFRILPWATCSPQWPLSPEAQPELLMTSCPHDTSRHLMWTPEKPPGFVGEDLLWLEALASWLGWSLPHSNPCTWPGWGPAGHLLRTFLSASGLPQSSC